MGMSPPSKPLSTPSRPFRPCRAADVLQRLILCRDWQRVLIRAQLFPHELSQPLKITVDNIPLRVLPLHLICALDPPEAVVRVVLDLFPSAALTRILPAYCRRLRRRRLREAVMKRLKQLRSTRHRRPLTQHDFPGQTAKDEVFFLHGEVDEDTSYYTACEDVEDGSSLNQSGEASSRLLLSQPSDLRASSTSVALQLCSSDGPMPLPLLNQRPRGDSLASVASKPSFDKSHWDLNLLRSEVGKRGHLLPLHLACFYHASVEVIEALLQTFPPAALCDILGMLPMYWVACGFALPPLLAEPPPRFSPLKRADPANTGFDAMAVLRLLKRSVPESIRVQSRIHGMTPRQYTDLFTDEGHGDEWFQVLDDFDSEDWCDLSQDFHSTSSSSVASDISLFLESDSSSLSCFPIRGSLGLGAVSRLIEERRWESVGKVVKEEPACASRWIYGMDNTIAEQSIWKRLPLHVACAHGAPVEILHLLVEAYPDGISTVDPQAGRLPLHWLVTRKCSVPQVDYLLHRFPEGSKKLDWAGRLPIHIAVSASDVTFDVVEAMIEHDPPSTTIPDRYDKTALEYAKATFGSGHMITELLEMVQQIPSVAVKG